MRQFGFGPWPQALSGGGAAATPPLLDALPTPALAVSTRRLSTAYTGRLMSFQTGVSIWRDQSGAGLLPTAPSNADLPAIIENAFTGRLCGVRNVSTDVLILAALLDLSTTVTAAFVIITPPALTDDQLWAGQGNNNYVVYADSVDIYTKPGTSFHTAPHGFTALTKHQVTIHRNGASADIRVDGVSKGIVTITNNVSYQLKYFLRGLSLYDGAYTFGEMIFWSSYLSAEDLAIVEASQMAFQRPTGSETYLIKSYSDPAALTIWGYGNWFTGPDGCMHTAVETDAGSLGTKLTVDTGNSTSATYRLRMHTPVNGQFVSGMTLALGANDDFMEVELFTTGGVFGLYTTEPAPAVPFQELATAALPGVYHDKVFDIEVRISNSGRDIECDLIDGETVVAALTYQWPGATPHTGTHWGYFNHRGVAGQGYTVFHHFDRTA